MTKKIVNEFNQEFEITDRKLLQRYLSGAREPFRYVVLAELKAAIKKDSAVMVYYPKHIGAAATAAFFGLTVTKTMVRIGCQRFHGKNAQAIKAALRSIVLRTGTRRTAKAA